MKSLSRGVRTQNWPCRSSQTNKCIQLLLIIHISLNKILPNLQTISQNSPYAQSATYSIWCDLYDRRQVCDVEWLLSPWVLGGSPSVHLSAQALHTIGLNASRIEMLSSKDGWRLTQQAVQHTRPWPRYHHRTSCLRVVQLCDSLHTTSARWWGRRRRPGKRVWRMKLLLLSLMLRWLRRTRCWLREASWDVKT